MSRRKMKSAATALCRAQRIVALTGAGISVESGIPDFHSATGLWAKYPPEDYATREAFDSDPDKVWRMWYELLDLIGAAKPNAAHTALADLERMGKLPCLVTQNVDRLHNLAGNTSVIEYHGSIQRMVCTVCDDMRPLETHFREVGAPPCVCGGPMKPDVVMFGEDIPKPVRLQAQMAAQNCDLMLVIGTSAMVHPASELPQIARENGATIIECNLAPTELTKDITDLFVEGPVGETLPQLLLRLGLEESHKAMH